ncbi:unnamed protein product [Caenorhabditis angaria]|uniref:Uncharacterized protein n=1 Tax=Caenorhabditis angaria TaxID=860376 RepID=A0A9P1MUY0_9PELO|nr:unnamed protein product [Caenorhabditis angaria]
MRSYRGKLVYRPYKKYDFEMDEKKYDVYGNTTEERIAKLDPKPTDWVIHENEDSENKEDLVTIEDDFINIYAVTISHIACDGPFSPTAKLEDNRIFLSYILKRDVTTRVDIAKYLLAIEHQAHLDLPFVKVVEVSSLSLDVIDEGSYVVVDGEVVETKTLKVTTTRNNMAVFSPSSD